MRIERLELTNYRGFVGDHVIDLPPGNVALWVGANGAGKTSVLDAMGTALDWFPALFQDVPLPIHDPHAGSDAGDRSRPSKLSLTAAYRQVAYLWWRHQRDVTDGLVSTEWSRPFPPTEDLLTQAREIYVGTTPRPMFAYTRAGSSRRPKRGESRHLGTVHPSLAAYDGAFDDSPLQVDALTRWYEQEENVENQERIAKKDLDFSLPSFKAVREALRTTLTALQDEFVTEPRVIRSRKNGPLGDTVGRIAFQKGDTTLFLDQLSEGERRIAVIVIDTARRMAILNPSMSHPLETPGVLLIDEVELHLHPKWQRRVIPALMKTFPNLQIIATTHSPQVLSSVPNEALIVLDGGKVLPGRHYVSGRDSNSILTDVMGVDERPAEAAAEIHELAKLINNNPASARPRLTELELKYGPDDPDLVRARALIDFMVD